MATPLRTNKKLQPQHCSGGVPWRLPLRLLGSERQLEKLQYLVRPPSPKLILRLSGSVGHVLLSTRHEVQTQTPRILLPGNARSVERAQRSCTARRQRASMKPKRSLAEGAQKARQKQERIGDTVGAAREAAIGAHRRDKGPSQRTEGAQKASRKQERIGDTMGMASEAASGAHRRDKGPSQRAEGAQTASQKQERIGDTVGTASEAPSGAHRRDKGPSQRGSSRSAAARQHARHERQQRERMDGSRAYVCSRVA